jgi:chromosome segregation ATPase
VFVDPDGRLGTIPIAAGGIPNKSSSVQPQAIPHTAEQAMLNLKVQNLRATVTQQQQQIERLTAQLKENTAQIQKTSAQLDMNEPEAKVVVNKPKAVR